MAPHWVRNIPSHFHPHSLRCFVAEEGHLDDDENDDDDDDDGMDDDADDAADDDDDDDGCLAHEAGHREPAQLFVKLLRSALDMQTLDMHAHIGLVSIPRYFDMQTLDIP